eukprot:681256-Pyramimonas_sp.AAC.1
MLERTGARTGGELERRRAAHRRHAPRCMELRAPALEEEGAPGDASEEENPRGTSEEENPRDTSEEGNRRD